MSGAELPLVDVDRLRVGMYVVLDVGWGNHPFLRNRFRIRNADQIAQIRALGLTKVRWSPERSTCGPGPEPESGRAAHAAPPAASSSAAATAAPAPAPAARTVEPVPLEEWERVAESWLTEDYASLARRQAELGRLLQRDPAAAREIAVQIAGELSDAVVECDRPAVRLLAGEHGPSPCHEIAVMALALLLGRDAGLADDELDCLALAALLHDAGKAALPEAVRENDGRLAPAALAAYRSHVQRGLELGQKMGLDPAVLRCMAEHHEHLDGSGFPAGLRGEQISLPGRVLAIANRYVDLVQPRHGGEGLTPHRALQTLYARERDHFDPALLARFVRLLGVYPPGSLVELSDGRMALVIASRPGASLTPRVRVLLRDDGRELGPALDLDVGSPVSIRRSLGPGELSPELARRCAELARAAFLFEPEQAPEWRSWGEDLRETEASF